MNPSEQTIQVVFLPDSRQALLLSAILAPDGKEAEKIRAWLDAVDLDRLDQGTMRLIPLLVERTRDIAIDTERLARLRAIQRQYRAKNQRLIHAANQAADALGAAGFEVLALKGVALAGAYYANVGLRPMDDIDLLVRPGQLGDAAEALRRSGWRHEPPAPRTEFDRNIHKAINLVNEAAPVIVLDLHARLFEHRFSEAATAALWEHAHPLPNSNLLVPCAADLLLHVCGHGAAYNPLPPVRWVADAAMILRRGAVDWPYLARQCAAWQIAGPVARCLEYLESMGEETIPVPILAELNNQQQDSALLRIDRISQVPSHQHGMSIGDRLFLHRHIARNTNPSTSGRPQYLKYALSRLFKGGPIAILQRVGRMVRGLFLVSARQRHL